MDFTRILLSTIVLIRPILLSYNGRMRKTPGQAHFLGVVAP